MSVPGVGQPVRARRNETSRRAFEALRRGRRTVAVTVLLLAAPALALAKNPNAAVPPDQPPSAQTQVAIPFVPPGQAKKAPPAAPPAAGAPAPVPPAAPPGQANKGAASLPPGQAKK